MPGVVVEASPFARKPQISLAFVPLNSNGRDVLKGARYGATTPWRRSASSSSGSVADHGVLDFDSATHGVHHGAELDQRRVAGDNVVGAHILSPRSSR